MKYLSILIFLILSNQLIHSQINIGGKPKSFTLEISKQLPKQIQVIEMPVFSKDSISKQDEIQDIKGNSPWRFGVNIKTDISPKNSGTWTNLTDGGRLWQLKIVSKGAQTINIACDNFKLPKGGLLYLYNPENEMILGGFTENNNLSYRTFSSELLHGDLMIIEYYEPETVEFEADIHIFNVTHGYRSLNYEKGFGSSGSCNMNVSCEDGLSWENEIRSVCMLVSGSNGFCTGALVNNTAEDETPYLLTADHCYENPEYLLFRFNWQSENCPNPSTRPSFNSVNGAKTIAMGTASDFWLLEMSQIPPPEYNVYYAGWDIAETAPSSAVCIHHPSGDIKKISFDDDPLQSSDYQPSTYMFDSHWKIEKWERQTTTEGGSSGSPLFNPEHRIVGQLHGGWASCESFTSDYFGKFALSWDYYTANDKRLQPWLDPLGAGLEQLNGFDPSAARFNRDLRISKILAPEQQRGHLQALRPEFLIRNQGFDTIFNGTVKFFDESSFSGEITFSDTLAPYATARIRSDSEFFPPQGTYKFTTYTSEINGFEDENSTNDSITIIYNVFEQIFLDEFESETLWELSGEFQIAEPKSENFTNAFVGTQILGTDLTGLGSKPGDYESELDAFQYFAISPLIDASDFEQVQLSYKSRSSFETRDRDKADVQLMVDTDTISIYKNPTSGLIETDWTDIYHNIAEITDNKRFRIKFTLGATDMYNQLTGWNIDELSVFGIRKQTSNAPRAEARMYPNPNNGKLYVELSKKPQSMGEIKISDISGRVVQVIPTNLQEFIAPGNVNTYFVFEANISQLPSGVYLVSVIFPEFELTEKIIINR